MADLAQLRAKYPEYNDMSDQQFADSFHAKFYSDITKEQFYQKINAVPDNQTISKMGSFGLGVADTASMGFDDEMRGVGRAIGTKLRGGRMTIGEGIEQLRTEHATAQKNSGSYTAGQITGAVLPALATQGKSLAKNTPLLTKMTTGAMQAAPQAAAYGVGSGEGAEDRILKGLGYGAGAATVGAALPAVVPAAKAVGRSVSGATDSVVSGVKAAAPEQMDEVARGFGREASELYTKFRDTGATLNKNRAVNIYNKMEKAVLSAGKTNPRLHGDTLSVLEDVRNAVKSGDPVGLEELDQLRQLLDDVITKNTDVAGKLNADALRSVKAKAALDESVGSLNAIDIVGGKKEAVDLLLAGRAKWAQKQKYEMVSRVLKKANGDPAKIKAGFERLANDPKKLKGFTKEEIAAIKAAGNNTMSEKILKGLGRFGIDPGNVFLPVVTGGLGALGGAATGTAAAPVAGTLVGVGTVARQANKYVARGKADKVLKKIQAR